MGRKGEGHTETGRLSLPQKSISCEANTKDRAYTFIPPSPHLPIPPKPLPQTTGAEPSPRSVLAECNEATGDCKDLQLGQS